MTSKWRDTSKGPGRDPGIVMSPDPYLNPSFFTITYIYIYIYMMKMRKKLLPGITYPRLPRKLINTFGRFHRFNVLMSKI